MKDAPSGPEPSRGFSPNQSLLAAIAAATQPLVESAEIMATTARLLAESLNVTRCAYAEVDAQRDFVITGDYSRGVASIVGRWPVAAFGPACVRCMLAGEPYVVDDVEAHSEVSAEHLPAYRATAIRAVICVPLHKNGIFTAAMAVHQNEVRHWTGDEIELVRLVVARCWEALERARIARALVESEARYRIMVETSPECVSVTAANGEIQQLNAAGLRLLGIAEGDSAVGRNLYEWIVPEDRERFRQLNDTVRLGQAGSLAFSIESEAGARRFVETTAVPLSSGPSEVRLLGVSRDVTARVSAERALAESRARLDYAVRLSGVGFWYCDLPFDELIWDENVKKHFFLPPDARVTIETFYARIHEDDRAATERAINDSIARHTSYDVVYRTVEPVSGRIHWIRALGGTTYQADGAPLRFDGVTVDVSADASLNDQLREQDRRKDEFLATLAHELRNPLAPIRTGLQVLQMSEDREVVAKTRGMMERQLGHLVRLVDDLLDVSRITLGKLQLKREAVDFGAIAQSAIETTRSLIDASEHELVVRIPSSPMPLDVDPTRLAQVFANLINNAAKYTPPRGRIELAVELEGDTLIARVVDTGRGIPQDMLPKVFEMFTQVGGPSEGGQGGLGIGLTLVRRLVEMHGGSVEAESDGHSGSTFTVRLPLNLKKAAKPRPDSLPPAAARAPLRILVVDDNVDGAESLQLFLQLSGHETRLAHDGRQGLTAASEFEPHVVFLDIGLPDMSGYDVARALSADPSTRPLRIVALTGWGSEHDRRQAQAAGFDAHLTKPVDLAKIKELIGEVEPR